MLLYIRQPTQGRLRARLPKGLRGKATTMREEMEKVLEEYRKLEVEKKGLWFSAENVWCLEAETKEVDMRGREGEEVVGKVLEGKEIVIV